MSVLPALSGTVIHRTALPRCRALHWRPPGTIL